VNSVVISTSRRLPSDQAHESTRVAATWIREEKLEDVLPNTPKITAGEVVVHETNGALKA
jgi:hypothetical protein